MSNKARCNACNVVIVSTSLYDFAQCPGGHIFVDGGDDYGRSGYDIPQNFTRIFDDGTEMTMVDLIGEYKEAHPIRTQEQEDALSYDQLPKKTTEEKIDDILEMLRVLKLEIETMRKGSL